MSGLSSEDLQKLEEITLFLHELMDKVKHNTFRYVQRVGTRNVPDIVILAAREEEVIPVLDYARENKVKGFMKIEDAA